MTNFKHGDVVICIDDVPLPDEVVAPIFGQKYVIAKPEGFEPHPLWTAVNAIKDDGRLGLAKHFLSTHFQLLTAASPMEAGAQEYEEIMRGLDLVKIDG